MKKILVLFSFVFHPIFFPIFGTLFYCYFTQNYLAKDYFYFILFQVIIITFLLPLLFFYLLKSFGKADTIMLSEINQRKLPLISQLILTIVLLQKTITVDRFPELYYFFVASCVAIVIVFLLLYLKIKASIHLLAISSFTFFAVGMTLHNQINTVIYIAIFFFLTGFVAASRLLLRAHTSKELVIGYLIGMLSQVVVFYFWL